MFQQSPALAQSKSLRFTTLCLLYVCQGLPIGIFQVALPAWFAAEGLSVSEIGGFIAIVFLPWGFKLLAGPLMDRFAFPPMGRRRLWILLAQMGIIGSFLLIAVLSPDAKENYWLLAALGFLANFLGKFRMSLLTGWRSVSWKKMSVPRRMPTCLRAGWRDQYLRRCW